MFQVRGSTPAVLQEFTPEVEHWLIAEDTDEKGVMPEPNMVRITSPVTRMTTVATIITRVKDIPFMII
jgi:hypothetical protein